MTDKFRQNARRVLPATDAIEPDLAATSAVEPAKVNRTLSPIKWGKVTDIGKDFRPMPPSQGAPVPGVEKPPKRPAFARTPVPPAVPVDLEKPVVEGEGGPDPKGLSAQKPASTSVSEQPPA
jgi:hypothetical protein